MSWEKDKSKIISDLDHIKDVVMTFDRKLDRLKDYYLLDVRNEIEAKNEKINEKIQQTNIEVATIRSKLLTVGTFLSILVTCLINVFFGLWKR